MLRKSREYKSQKYVNQRSPEKSQEKTKEHKKSREKSRSKKNQQHNLHGTNRAPYKIYEMLLTINHY